MIQIVERIRKIMKRIQFTSSVHPVFTVKTFAEWSAITSNCVEAEEGRPPFTTETMPRLHNEAQIQLLFSEKQNPGSLEPCIPPRHIFKVQGGVALCLTLSKVLHFALELEVCGCPWDNEKHSGMIKLGLRLLSSWTLSCWKQFHPVSKAAQTKTAGGSCQGSQGFFQKKMG